MLSYQEWIDDLSNHEQGQGCLYSDEGHKCCLGVLGLQRGLTPVKTETFDVFEGTNNMGLEYDGISFITYLPASLAKEYGLDQTCGTLPEAVEDELYQLVLLAADNLGWERQKRQEFQFTDLQRVLARINDGFQDQFATVARCLQLIEDARIQSQEALCA